MCYPHKLKSDKEKSKHASLAQQAKWFWPNIFFWHCLLRLVKAQHSLTRPVRKECNKSDFLHLVHDWSRCFAISSLPPICNPSFSFMGGVVKKKIDKNIVAGSHAEHLLEPADALRLVKIIFHFISFLEGTRKPLMDRF